MYVDSTVCNSAQKLIQKPDNS